MKTATPSPPLRSVKVLDQLRERIRYLHYSLRTEQAYVNWVRAFIRFTVCVTRQQAAKSSISVLAGERAQGFGLHASSRHWRPCCSSTAKVLCTDLPRLRRSEDLGPSRRLPVVRPRMKWFASSVFWKASIVCSPSFCMERACGSVRVCNCGSGSGFDHGTIIVRRQGLGSGLDVTRELGTNCASAVACTGMVAEGPGRRAAAALCALAPLAEVSARRSIPGRGSGFCAAHAFDDPRSGVVRRHHIAMTRPFSAPSNDAVEQAGITSYATSRQSDALLHCGGFTTFEPCRICSAIPTSLRR